MSRELTELEKLHEIFWDAESFLVNGVPATHFYACDAEEVDIEDEDNHAEVILELITKYGHERNEYTYYPEDLRDAQILNTSIRIGNDIITPLFSIDLTEF